MIKALSLSVLCLLTACSDDAPLLSTPLPNGYSFRSNGGDIGAIYRPNGTRLAQYFGITEQHGEIWCSKFAWQGDWVIYEKYREIRVNDQWRTVKDGYYCFDTASGTMHSIDAAAAKSWWQQQFDKEMPRLATRFAQTTK